MVRGVRYVAGDAQEVLLPARIGFSDRAGLLRGLIKLCSINSQGDAVRGEPYEMEVVLGKAAGLKGINVEHTDQPLIEQERHAQERSDLLMQERIGHLMREDIIQDEGLAGGRDLARHAVTDRDANAILDL